MGYQSELTKAGIDTKGHFSGMIKTQCPWCAHTRKKSSDPSLSVNIDEGLFKCHHCQKKGSVANVKQYTKPEPKTEAPDSRVTKYFESRGISQETVDAFGVSMSIEWMPQDEQKHKVICFNYYDGDELVNIKFKTSDKKFKMVSGAKKIPYNLNRIKDSTEIIICEGEEEAMVWYQAGYPFAVSCPNGAGVGVNNLQWLDDTYTHFENKKIIIATDNDGPGQKLKEDLARRFDQSDIFIVQFPSDAKDANDVLKAHGVEAIKKLYSEAQPIPIKEIAEVNDFLDLIELYQTEGFPIGCKVNMPETDKHLSWNKGELVVVSGIPSFGKTTWLDYTYVRLSQIHGWKFGIFSPENMAPLKITRLAEQLSGKAVTKMNRAEIRRMTDILRKHFYFFNTEKMEDFSLPALLDTAKTMVKRYGIDCLCLDPFNYIDNPSKEDSTHDRAGDLLRELKKFAVHNDINVTLVAHPRKQDKSGGQYVVPRMYDIAQSSHFYNVPDVGIIVHRTFVDGVNDPVDIYIQKMKHHFRGQLGSVAYQFDRATGRYTENGRYDDLLAYSEKQWETDFGASLKESKD
jgi:twinkle protein